MLGALFPGFTHPTLSEALREGNFPRPPAFGCSLLVSNHRNQTFQLGLVSLLTSLARALVLSSPRVGSTAPQRCLRRVSWGTGCKRGCPLDFFFLPEPLLTSENSDSFAKNRRGNSSTITSELQPQAVMFSSSLLGALNPKKLSPKFSRSRFINSSCN